ncbi:VOC family protein [Erwinia mallotivora]|uniref:Lactoylglutathione lyase n=1 Tax=Erwinia mallotivora TaxID=69222 RepID=A0A014PZ38_9GAMM|nr:VOC family protein [Erwinia mallotivora]EXU76222.1 lactoylglutathione lyase [Erwinia mallotivora]
MISHLDHLVLTTHDVDTCVDFYTRILGFQLETFHQGRLALKFGEQKINIHEQGKEIEPKAHLPVPGSLDLCFITTEAIEEVKAKFEAQRVTILERPVTRTGARGSIISLYIRDPDLNLIEIASYPPTQTEEQPV